MADSNAYVSPAWRGVLLVLATACSAGPRPAPRLADATLVRDPQIEAIIDHLPRTLVPASEWLGPPRALPATRGTVLAEVVPALYATAARWIDVPSSKQLEGALDARSEALGRTLRDANLGYYVLVDRAMEEGRPSVEITPYHVMSTFSVEIDGTPHAMLAVRAWSRLDEARWFGRTIGSLGLVSLDALDSAAIKTLLPVLGADEPYRGLERASPVLARLAGDAMRTELLAALGTDATLAAHVGALVAERDRIVEGWPRVKELILVDAERFGLFSAKAILDAAASPEERARVLELERRLEQMEATRIAARLSQLLARSALVHEGQHVFDLPRKRLRMSALEARAYLGELARDRELPHVTLWMLAAATFASTSYDPESYAGTVVIEGLAGYFGATAEAPLVDEHGVIIAELVELAIRVAARTSEELHQAAGAVWQERYAEPLVPIIPRGRVDRRARTAGQGAPPREHVSRSRVTIPG